MRGAAAEPTPLSSFDADKGVREAATGILVAVMTFVMTPDICVTGVIDLVKDIVDCSCAALPLLVFVDGVCLTPREQPSEELSSEELSSEELSSEELPLADPTV